MQITIRFDKDSSKWVDKNFEFNRLFVKTQHEYIKDLSKHQGYIYLNTIYELLGLRWDPYDENVCRTRYVQQHCIIGYCIHASEQHCSGRTLWA